MPAKIEFFVDVVSPHSYLAWTQLDALERNTGAMVIVRPVCLSSIVKAAGGAVSDFNDARSRYQRRDLQRWAEYYGVPFRLNPFYPISTLAVMRGAAGCENQMERRRYLHAMFQAMWVDGRNLSEPQELRAALETHGLDAAAILARSHAPDVKKALSDTTSEAIDRGVFGAPTFFVGDEMFFGRDRLPMVEMFAKGGSTRREFRIGA